MAVNKTVCLNMRVKPQTKLALQVIGKRENRSMANALEWLIAEYMARNNLEMPSPRATRVKAQAVRGASS